ncbi:MBL fold metallo-hydrolase [Fulvimarina sp. 2208YS6-2-32]|uniref:MBL fold metallo-hydrolase n=1 Tax=Fulvimarina uroteuthidis TaxID=3098149 RepID=A0ABU5I4A6_9HYPH|nr:MBL fold metallo-hydrolase [Fulvimarina sp. 2208YS6-2-32]MDY8108996.1 MBL fold metallo-hydrolase [Fulvimarina sp. 2208YS6-2-32]
MKNPYYAGPKTDHFDGTRFFSPGALSTDKSVGDLLRWKLREKTAPWPKAVPVEPIRPEARVGGCRATMIGHASVLLQVGNLNILTDPVYSQRVSPVSFAGPRRVAAPGIRFADLPQIDLVLLSHNHYDHCDVATLKALDERFRPRVVTALGNDRFLREAIPGLDVTAGDWGDVVSIDKDASVALTPAHHWSSRGVRDRRMALWCGFVLKTPRAKVYFVGDSGYGDGGIFRQIAERHGEPDLALIPIGAYAPRWFMQSQHMNPEEAVDVFEAIGARHALAIHWGTFQLTDEPRHEPPARLAETLAARGIDPDRFVAPEPGGVLDLSGAAH